jgi:hypothetical protein
MIKGEGDCIIINFKEEKKEQETQNKALELFCSQK